MTNTEIRNGLADVRARLASAGLPSPVSSRCGCKVAWETYALETDARKRAEFAREEARYVAALGYDFGYQSPGSVTRTSEGWEVCLP